MMITDYWSLTLKRHLITFWEGFPKSDMKIMVTLEEGVIMSYIELQFV